MPKKSSSRVCNMSPEVDLDLRDNDLQMLLDM